MAHESTLRDDHADRTSFWGRLLDAAMSLQFRATAVVVALTLTVTAGVSGYLLRSSGELARHEHGTHLVQVAALMAKAAAPLMMEGDAKALQALADESARDGPLLYVMFLSPGGAELAAAERRAKGVLQTLDDKPREGVPVPGHPVFRTSPSDASVTLDVTYPVSTRLVEPREKGTPAAGSSILLGYVRAGMTADEWHHTMSGKLDLVIGVGILATVAAIPLGFVLVRRFVRPLDGLADAMRKFSQGQLAVRSPVRRWDEIGRLASAFNQMADQQQQTHDRLVRLNAELERRVAQRTRQLRELASRDPLTGLYNRRYFNETLAHRFSEALRYQTDLSCLMIDLDGFKAVNDTFGHHIGDELLVLTANTIMNCLRSADVAARFGGDELVVLLPHTDAERARVLGERIIEQFGVDVTHRIPHVRASMSMGIASLPSPDLRDAESLIRAADHALYEAKAGGKNRIVTAVTVAPATPS